MQALKDISYPTDVVAEADMVMKGGITSGVVYPLAVCQLAQSYRFRNLGGSSAGGIAAAFAAAAECNRAGGGFQELAKLPGLLGTNLRQLFQPSPSTRPLFRILLAAIDHRHKGLSKDLRVLVAIVRAAWRWFLGADALVLLLGIGALLLARGAPHSGGDWLDLSRGLPPLLVVGVLVGLPACLIGLVRLAKRELPANGHGLCLGSRGADWPTDVPSSAVEPFTDWMHAHLNKAAGLARSEVLTIGRLWGPAAVKRFTQLAAKVGPADAMRAIGPHVRLEMMTTDVTSCRPSRLPFADRSHLFCATELAPYVPRPVLDHLVTTAWSAAGVELPHCPNHTRERLLHLPDAPDFPVVLAVRMTLSFPGLISAVPLYMVDYATSATPVRCWFSDGGISSNFPIHFFDALWPRRPTFGISLGPYAKPGDSDVHLPAHNEPRLPRRRPTETLGQFVGALLDTMQNWSDEGQCTLPGYRDRIAEIHHTSTEGGLNLTMEKDTIETLAWRGLEAGKAFDRFDFARHRWTRYLTAMGDLDVVVRGMQGRYDDPLPGGLPGYAEFVRSASGLGYERSARWRRQAVERTDDLLTFVVPPARPDLVKGMPRPVSDLRITPHF
jgi:hypothetical protein